MNHINRGTNFRLSHFAGKLQLVFLNMISVLFFFSFVFYSTIATHHHQWIFSVHYLIFDLKYLLNDTHFNVCLQWIVYMVSPCYFSHSYSHIRNLLTDFLWRFYFEKRHFSRLWMLYLCVGNEENEHFVKY